MHNAALTRSSRYIPKPSAAHHRASLVAHGHVLTGTTQACRAYWPTSAHTFTPRSAQPLQPAFYASNRPVTQVNPAQEAIELIVFSNTSSSTQETTQRDIAYQKAKGAGTSDGSAQYNELSYGKLAIKADTITVQTGVSSTGKGQVPSNVGASTAATPAQLKDLASKPGMSWVNDVAAQSAEIAKTNPAAALHIQQVQLAHNQWDYKRQGLTKEGAAIVSLVVAYFTGGAASGLGTSLAAGVGATGMTATVIAGATTAALTTLATQASVSMINNRGNLSAVLKELGSSDSVRGLLTAMVTGGVLAGMNFSPLGQPTIAGGAQTFTAQLGQNLQAGIARTLITTAINGGSLEAGLKTAILSALIDTAAAQGAFAIGGNLDGLANKLAHAIAGCAAGAAKANNSGGCAAGAIGASVGEIAAEGYGVQRDTVEFAAMISGIAVAVAGGDAAQIGIGSAAGSNAAANNYLSHNKPPNSPRLSEREQLERARAECGPSNAAACDTATRLTQRSRDRDAVLVNACKDPGSSACRTEIRQAVAAGNTIDLRTGLPYSQGDGPPATIGPVTNAATNSWHNQQASSLAEGLINETFGAVAGAALRVIVAGSEIAVAGVRYGVNGTMEFLSSTGQVTGRMVNGEVLDALGGVIARQNPLNPGEFVAVARPGSSIGETVPPAGTIRGVNPTNGQMNCVNCVVATDATLRGYPTAALPGGPYTLPELERNFSSTFRPAALTDIERSLLLQGNGATGIVYGYPPAGSNVGHVFNV
jgi:Possible hemagglutinin (DUF637)/Papain fold toxin 1, glutamine deamidase